MNLKMYVLSLMELSATAAVQEYHLFDERLKYLPETVIQTLLFAAVRDSRILTFRKLICNWPIAKLVLRNCKEFNVKKAVVLACCLQREKPRFLRVIDLRGCEIGYQGTIAFMKMAVGLPISENDVPPLEFTISHKPVSVFMSCIVDNDNVGLVKQALIQHTILDLKVTSLSVTGVERAKVMSLLSLAEPDILNELNLSISALESSGIISAAPILARFRNLTVLNLAYNCLQHTDSRAIEVLSTAFKNMKLKSLDLSGNRIRSGIVQLLGAVTSPLSKLLLNGCGIQQNELQLLSNMEQVHHLEHFELGSNYLVDCMDMVVFFISKLSRSLTYLNLDGNMFDSSVVGKFASMIESLEFLSTLSMSYNHFLPEDRQTIAQKFPYLQIAEYKE